MKKTINDFINSIDTKLYSRLRGSMGDAECRRYLKEHLQKQLTIHSVSKSFYCWDSAVGEKICDKQCNDCAIDQIRKKTQ